MNGSHIFLPGSAAAKAKQADQVEVDYDSEEDEDYEAGEDQEDIDLEDFEEEDNEELLAEETEEEMSTPGRKKRTPKKQYNPTPAGESPVDDITSSLKKLSVSFTPFSLNWVFPYTISTYDESDDVMCDVNLFVPTIPKQYFIPDVVQQGKVLAVSTRMPNFFTSGARILVANEGSNGFNQNTSQAQAHKNEDIDAKYDFKTEVYCDPQHIHLPFVVEERIVSWEVQAYPNNLTDESNTPLIDQLGGEQFHFTLYIKLRKHKTKKKTTGGFRIIGGAAAAAMEDEDD